MGTAGQVLFRVTLGDYPRTENTVPPRELFLLGLQSLTAFLPLPMLRHWCLPHPVSDRWSLGIARPGYEIVVGFS